jgi:S-adenosylmethionine:tRNA ribosyltransferase-isomerase
VNVADFDFDLPPDLIAQEPPPERGGSRLLVLDRVTGRLSDSQFRHLPQFLARGDLLVVNDTRVFPARLLGRRLPGGGAVECLLVQRVQPDQKGEPFDDSQGSSRPFDVSQGRPEPVEGGAPSRDEVWEALVHPGQRLKPGSRMEFERGKVRIHGEVLERRFYGRRTVRLWTDSGRLDAAIDEIGHVPLPPYIKRPDRPEDRDRYQTVYADARGSIAAPTAGLHFTPALLEELKSSGIERASITLHVGYGTFQPVRVDRVEDHRMEPEFYEVSPATALMLTRALAERKRIVAVGTTTTRTLESLAVTPPGAVQPGHGSTDLFIYPGHEFRLVSGLVTNFHLPRSSLAMLVSAVGGREHLLAAYRHAVEQRYRFYSYGDAMLVL